MILEKFKRYIIANIILFMVYKFDFIPMTVYNCEVVIFR